MVARWKQQEWGFEGAESHSDTKEGEGMRDRGWYLLNGWLWGKWFEQLKKEQQIEGILGWL